MTRRFHDRTEAGRLLAERLEHLRGEQPIVLALPRGGVPIGFEVARHLDAPLDVIVVRKLGVPFQPELGMGAVGEGGVLVLNDDVLRLAHVGREDLTRVEEQERAEVERRAKRFRGGREPASLEGRTVIVVDDGIATGGTARAALQVARARGARRVVLGVPVAPPETLRELTPHADEVVCVESPRWLSAIGEWYMDFTQVPDERVVELLTASDTVGGDVELDAGDVTLPGRLAVPRAARGVVLFAHGSGSSRHSSRNRYVASQLEEAGLATLLFDLLTAGEERDRANVFDVELLGHRLAAARSWVRDQPSVAPLAVGYFGASTGAAAALWAAAEPGADVHAVVSRGGRPDLAGPRLAAVRAPTLLVVGSRDEQVLTLNREAAAQLQCEHRVEVVPGATHLFEEPGTLDTVAGLARAWFLRHLSSDG